MRGAKAIAKREFWTMMGEKSFVLVLLFEILLVSSSAFLAVGYEVLTSPENSPLLKGTRNVIYVGVVTESTRELALPLKNSGITYFYYNTLTDAEEDFKRGFLDAVVIGNLNLRAQPSVLTVYLPKNTPKIGLIRLTLKRFFLDVEERLRNVKMKLYTPDLELPSDVPAIEESMSSTFEVFFIFTLPCDGWEPGH